MSSDGSSMEEDPPPRRSQAGSNQRRSEIIKRARVKGLPYTSWKGKQVEERCPPTEADDCK